MKLQLTRKWNTLDGIYGVLELLTDGWGQEEVLFSCYTVELPYKDNRPSISCIPTGYYKCIRGMYNRGGYETFELVDVPDRSEIKIHVANTPTDLEGCIGLGKSFGWIKGQYAVIASADTFKQFMKAMEGIDTITLIIIGEVPNCG